MVYGDDITQHVSQTWKNIPCLCGFVRNIKPQASSMIFFKRRNLYRKNWDDLFDPTSFDVFFPCIFWKKTTTQHPGHEVKPIFWVFWLVTQPPPHLFVTGPFPDGKLGEFSGKDRSHHPRGSREHTSWDPFMLEGTLSLKSNKSRWVIKFWRIFFQKEPH